MPGDLLASSHAAVEDSVCFSVKKSLGRMLKLGVKFKYIGALANTYTRFLGLNIGALEVADTIFYYFGGVPYYKESFIPKARF